MNDCSRLTTASRVDCWKRFLVASLLAMELLCAVLIWCQCVLECRLVWQNAQSCCRCSLAALSEVGVVVLAELLIAVSQYKTVVSVPRWNRPCRTVLVGLPPVDRGWGGCCTIGLFYYVKIPQASECIRICVRCVRGFITTIDFIASDILPVVSSRCKLQCSSVCGYGAHLLVDKDSDCIGCTALRRQHLVYLALHVIVNTSTSSTEAVYSTWWKELDAEATYNHTQSRDMYRERWSYKPLCFNGAPLIS